MPMYEVVTPLRRGRETVPPGEVVQLDAADGESLVRLNAAIARPDVAEPVADLTAGMLAKMKKADLLVVAVAKGITVAHAADGGEVALEAATNAQLVAAIQSGSGSA